MPYTNPTMVKAARQLREAREAAAREEAAKGVQQVQKRTATPGAASAAPRGTDGDSGKPSKAPEGKPKAQPQRKPAQGGKVAAAAPAKTVGAAEQGKKKRGRPFKDPSKKRTKTITVWVAEDEREKISQNAHALGMNVSEYVRQLAMAPQLAKTFNDLGAKLEKFTHGEGR